MTDMRVSRRLWRVCTADSLIARSLAAIAVTGAPVGMARKMPWKDGCP